ncbi:MAG: hypothetical protein ACKVT0_21095 [Planctomycetaceae bacterium]
MSIWLVFHLFAIIVAPWSVPPSSLLSQECWRICQPYLEALNLNHGYHFFAPEPGPSHLVRYEAVLQDGSKISGMIPDLNIHRPRLVYHRHFMLTEYLNRIAMEADDAGDPASFNALTKAYAEHILHMHDAKSVSLFLRRHYIPSPQQVQEQMPLNDRRLYAERPLGMFDEGDFAPGAEQRSPTVTAQRPQDTLESALR